MSANCEVAFGLRHELDVLWLSGGYERMHELRKRLSRHRHTCPICNGLQLHRQLWGRGVLVLEDQS